MASFRKANNCLNFQCYDLMHKESYTDVSIVCDKGGYMQAHQLILAASSNYFQKIFKIIPNNNHPVVILKDVTFIQLKLMIQFIYCGSVDIIPEEIEPFRNMLQSLEIDFEREDFDETEKVESYDEEADDEDELDFFETDIPGTGDIIDVEEPTWSDFNMKIKEEPKSEDECFIEPLKVEKVKSLLETALPSSPTTSSTATRPNIPIKINTSIFDHRYSQDPQRSLLPKRISLPKRFFKVDQPVARFNPKNLQPASTLETKISIRRVVPSKKMQKFMNDNPGKCPFCQRSFKTSKHRNEHVKYCFENPNRVVSTCPLCQKSVCDPYYLRKHLRNVHGNMDGNTHENTGNNGNNDILN